MNIGDIFSSIILYRLLAEGICHEKNIPSISSINRIIRDKAILQRRSLDSLSGISMCDSSDQEEVLYFFIRRTDKFGDIW